MLKTRTFWARFFLVMALATAVAIFFFSSQPGEDSAQLSEGVTLTVATVVRPGFERLPTVEKLSFLESLGLIVRKCAHFSEFALLGLNLMGYIRMKRPEMPARAALPIAWGVATLYAGTDELHQMFVDQRGPAFLDVGIDSAGALTGVLVMALLLALLARRVAALE